MPSSYTITRSYTQQYAPSQSTDVSATCFSESPVTLRSSPPRSAGWEQVSSRLLSFAKLEKGWDSYDGQAPSIEICVRSLLLLNVIQCSANEAGNDLPAPFVAPTAQGGIHMEWSVGRRQLEIRVGADISDEYEWVASVRNGQSYADYDGTFSDFHDPSFGHLIKWLITEK